MSAQSRDMSSAGEWRNNGLDLLRLVSMLMIVNLHVLGQGGILSSVIPSSSKEVILWGMEIASLCSVNCFAMISGYVGVQHKQKITNIFMLCLQVLFYCVLITLVGIVIDPSMRTLPMVVKGLFPGLVGRYWYFTAYFCLFFCEPLLNGGMKYLTQQYIEGLLCVFLVLFSLLPTLLGQDFFHVSNGYSVLWLIYMYLIGAYFRLYPSCNKRKYSYLMGYLIMVFVTCLIKALLEGQLNGAVCDTQLSERVIQYNCPLTLGTAIFLFLYFEKINLGEQVGSLLTRIAPLVFGVYIIHSHIFIFDYLLKGRFKGVSELPDLVIPIAILFIDILICSVCICIDSIRLLIFNRCGIRENLSKMGDMLYKVFYVRRK